MHRFFELLIAPYLYTDMLWILIPLVASIILMELYFGRYKYEELGWNSVFGNAIVLIFVGLDLFRRLYVNEILGFADIRNLLAIGILLEGVILTMTSFFHLLPKSWAFEVGAKLPTSLIAYMAVILVYSPFEIDLFTIIYAFIIVIALTMFLSSFRSIVPAVIESEDVGKAPEPEK